MLAVHLLWTDDDGGEFFLWGEDSDRSLTGPARRGRSPVVPLARPHPFTASGERLLGAVTDAAPSLHAAVAGASEGVQIVWLPGRAHAPLPSPELVRAEGGSGNTRHAPGLWPFEVTALRVRPSAALDVALALRGVVAPELHPGASVVTFSVLAALALEIVAAGRFLPNLHSGPEGYEARWDPLLNGADDERVRIMSRSLPPVCRSLTAAGTAPDGIVHHALDAFVDAVCRDALATSRSSVIRLPRRTGDQTPTPLEPWLTALSSPLAPGAGRGGGAGQVGTPDRGVARRPRQRGAGPGGCASDSRNLRRAMTRNDQRGERSRQRDGGPVRRPGDLASGAPPAGHR